MRIPIARVPIDSRFVYPLKHHIPAKPETENILMFKVEQLFPKKQKAASKDKRRLFKKLISNSFVNRDMTEALREEDVSILSL